MIEYLVEYYECAGFANYRKHVLDNMSDEEIIKSYYALKEDEEHPDRPGEFDKFPPNTEVK